MAPEIDQTVFSWSNFLFKLSGRQVPKQFVRSFQVGLPPTEGGVDERFLCGHSFTRLSFARSACPQSILFLPPCANYPPGSRHGGSKLFGVPTILLLSSILPLIWVSCQGSGNSLNGIKANETEPKCGCTAPSG